MNWLDEIFVKDKKAYWREFGFKRKTKWYEKK